MPRSTHQSRPLGAIDGSRSWGRRLIGGVGVGRWVRACAFDRLATWRRESRLGVRCSVVNHRRISVGPSTKTKGASEQRTGNLPDPCLARPSKPLSRATFGGAKLSWTTKCVSTHVSLVKSGGPYTFDDLRRRFARPLTCKRSYVCVCDGRYFFLEVSAGARVWTCIF